MAESNRTSLSPSVIAIYAVLIVAALYFLAPLYVMVVTSFKSLGQVQSGGLFAWPDPFTIKPWLAAWGSACTGDSCSGLKPYFLNSMAFTVPAVLLSTGFGAINGYLLTQWRFRGSEVIFGLLLFGMIVPYQMFLLPMADTLGTLGLSNSIVGLIVVHTIYGIAVTTLFCRNFFVTVPNELAKSARVDGAGFFSIFWHIALPLAVPILMVCMIWQFTQIWNDFLFGVVFTSGESHPITVALNNLVNTSSTGVKHYNVDMAAAMIAALPTFIVYIVAGRYFVRGLTAGAVKG
ncbi:carbohydrate ABC transporter permease [Salinisphaera orenii]|uniref:carbohydrate ABC transporter permease n=1 Tax=Salinisphaera orenii TaxID=856731 RepID=UPI000DBE1513